MTERDGQVVITLNSEIMLPEDAPVRLTNAQLVLHGPGVLILKNKGIQCMIMPGLLTEGIAASCHVFPDSVGNGAALFEHSTPGKIPGKVQVYIHGQAGKIKNRQVNCCAAFQGKTTSQCFVLFQKA